MLYVTDAEKLVIDTQGATLTIFMSFMSGRKRK